MNKEERGFNPQEGRDKLVTLPMQYQARIISGDFDSGKPLDLAEVNKKIAENNPVAAYAKMHEKWQGVRTADWKDDGRKFKDQVLGWASGRAARLLPQLQSGASADLLAGLKTMGLEIADPAATEAETLKTYFAETFYSQFASHSTEDEDRSVGNLVKTFFNAARQSPEDATSGLDDDKLQSVRAQVEALKPVLEPILKEDTFAKFEDVLEARFAAANGELAGIRNGKLSKDLTKGLEYFEPNQSPYVPKRTTGRMRPTPIPEPATTSREPAIVLSRTRTVRPAAAVSSEPTPTPTPTPEPVASPTEPAPDASIALSEHDAVVPEESDGVAPEPEPTVVTAEEPVADLETSLPILTEAVSPAIEDEVVLLDSERAKFIVDLNNAVLVAGKNNKQKLTVSVSSESLLLGEGYLLTDNDGDIKVEVNDPGNIEVTDEEDRIHLTGVSLAIDKKGIKRKVPDLNLSILATEDGIEVSVDDVEENLEYPGWNRQLVKEALASLHDRLRSKINKDLEEDNPGWAVTGKVIFESKRFRISLAKTLDDDLEPETPPPFPREAIVFPAETDDAEPIAVS